MSKRINSKKGRAPKKSPRKQVQTYDGSLSISNTLQRIPNQVGLIMPDRYRTKLRFWKAIKFDFTLSNTSSARFRPSAAFDVDPLVASTAMSGFAELALLYSSYRVLSSKVKTESVTTSAANPVTMIVAPVNFDPGAAPSSAFVLALKEQPYARYMFSGLTGSPPSKLVHTMSTEKMYGSKAALFDDNFSAPVTAIPNNNWYWVVAGYSFVLDPSLCWTDVTIEVDVEFFDRNFLLN